MADDDVTQWIERFVDGDESAVRHVWQYCWERLVRRARKNLGSSPRRAMDEEDVAQSAFDDFRRCAAAGKFPCLENRNDLWKLLATITARKAKAAVRKADRVKRGGGRVRGESAFGQDRGDSGDPGINQHPGQEPTPAFAALMNEQCQLLLDRLEDPFLYETVIYKFEGYTSQQIAEKMGSSLATVKRRLRAIRRIWEDEVSL